MEGQILTDGTQIADYLGMMKMRLMLAHTCIACGEIRDEDEISDRRTYIALFGVVAKNVCPSCYRDLGEEEREEVHAKWAKLVADGEVETDG